MNKAKKKSTPLLPFLSLEGSLSPPPLFTFRPWWIGQTSCSVVIDSVKCQKVFQKWERRDLHSEAISKPGSIKALLFQTPFSVPLILEWKVPQILSLQAIWNMERKSCFFFPPLVPWCRCILLFFWPEEKQVFVGRCDCNRGVCFQGAAVSEQYSSWRVQAIGCLFLISWLSSKSSLCSYYFCETASLVLAHPEVIYRLLALLYSLNLFSP